MLNIAYEMSVSVCPYTRDMHIRRGTIEVFLSNTTPVETLTECGFWIFCVLCFVYLYEKVTSNMYLF
jgi:hypothetical protein